MLGPLRIAITVDPYIPVPPQLYGGIERVVDFLVRGLMERGHQVAMIAHPESRTAAELIPYGVPPHLGIRPRLTELCQVGSILWRRRRKFDLIHSFGRLAALLPVLPARRLPKIQSYQREGVPWKGVKKAVLLAGSSIQFTGCSTNLYRERPRHGDLGGRWRTIFNGVDLTKYEFVDSVSEDAPLLFLGRLEPIKGAHNAIAIARAAGRDLIIAGNKSNDGPNADYFNDFIASHIDDQQIRYVGPVDDVQKNALLGSSSALLMPVEWEEPFGIVMAEAMACGTPVIGYARGSVAEVVRDGVNGFLCRTVNEGAKAVERVGEIDRSAVRADCGKRFSHSAVVDAYEKLYHELIVK